MEPCIQEKEIARLLTIMEQVVKEFYGNGREGISKTIPRLETQISTLIETSSGQAVAISALAKAVTEITSVDQYRKDESLNSWQRTSVIVSSIIGIAAVLATIIYKV